MQVEPVATRISSVVATIWRRWSQPHYGVVVLAIIAAMLLAIERTSELQRSYDLAEREAGAAADNLALALARDIEFAVSGIDSALTVLADELPLAPGYSNPGDANVAWRLKRHLAGMPPEVRGIYVLDEAGRFLHNTESSALIGADRSDRDYFQGVRRQSGLYVGAPIRSRTNEEAVISLTRRVDGEDGRFAGAISASLPLGRMEQFYARFDLAPSVAIALWRTDGILLARRPPAGYLVGTNPPDRPIQRAIDEGRREGLIKAVSPIDGKVGLGAFRVIDRYPFAVTVAIAEDGYLSEWRARRFTALRDLSLMILGLTAFATMLAIMFRRRNRERARAEDDMRKALHDLDVSNHAKTMFLANMSHELRTPLNAIIGFSEMIRDERCGPVGSPRYREYATHICGSGEHLLAVINDILDTTKIETGKWTLCYESLDAVRQVHEAVLTLQPLAAKAGLSISEDYAGDLPALTADRRALRQVLLNLLTNAVKFTPRGGSLRVAVKVNDVVMRISVSDTGIGMTAADLERIGRPFVRVGDPLASRAGGSGLGLALSKSLIEIHGGRMTIGSTVGRGTTVTVELPLELAVAA
jgi:signal transduction histidine kinase